jgi:hypothetical protein
MLPSKKVPTVPGYGHQHKSTFFLRQFKQTRTNYLTICFRNTIALETLGSTRSSGRADVAQNRTRTGLCNCMRLVCLTIIAAKQREYSRAVIFDKSLIKRAVNSLTLSCC